MSIAPTTAVCHSCSCRFDTSPSHSSRVLPCQHVACPQCILKLATQPGVVVCHECVSQGRTADPTQVPVDLAVLATLLRAHYLEFPMSLPRPGESGEPEENSTAETWEEYQDRIEEEDVRNGRMQLPPRSSFSSSSNSPISPGDPRRPLVASFSESDISLPMEEDLERKEMEQQEVVQQLHSTLTGGAVDERKEIEPAIPAYSVLPFSPALYSPPPSPRVEPLSRQLSSPYDTYESSPPVRRTTKQQSAVTVQCCVVS